MSYFHRRRSRAFTLLELVVVLAIIAVLMGLALPAIFRARAAADRVACANNLHQIGLACQQYHNAKGRFPQGVRRFEISFLSWETALLPYLEQDALDQDVQRSVAFPIPTSGPVLPGMPHQGLGTIIPVFGCPADGRTKSTQTVPSDLKVALTSYLGVLGTNRFRRDGVLFYGSQVRFADITDGASTTLMIGERPPYPQELWGVWYTGIWGSDTGAAVLGVREPSSDPLPHLTFQCGRRIYPFGPGSISNPCDAFHFWSLHTGGANFVFADGSARFLSYSADSVLPALATRAGGEVVDLP